MASPDHIEQIDKGEYLFQQFIEEKFNTLAQVNIHFPKEWKKYYIDHNKLHIEQLGHKIPFGPYKWTCTELENIKESCKPNGKNHNKNYVDIAIIGRGLGYYTVLSMTKDGQYFFFRIAGGSNDYSRIANFQKFQYWDPTEHEPLFTISEVINLLENNINDTHCQKGNSENIDIDTYIQDSKKINKDEKKKHP